MIYYPFVAILLAVSLAEDDQSDNIGDLPLQNPDLFQGDIIGIEDVDDKNAYPDAQRRWTNRVIPYALAPSLAKDSSIIKTAIREYHRKTCLRFKPRTTEKDYLYIFSGTGCYSYIGMKGGRQELSLGPGCLRTGIILHEFGHAIGFFHEHCRSDRDIYLIIYWDNIKKGEESQFRLLSPDQNLLLDFFDYNSIMMYSNTHFSKDGKTTTMKARTGHKLTASYKKSALSTSDVKRIRIMYEC